MTRSGLSMLKVSGLDPVVADLLEALADRVQLGETIDPDELAREYPEHAEQLLQLLPAVQMLATLDRSAESGSFPPDSGELDTGTLGDYRIIREVGRGGMGVVYEAEQVSLSRRVALKVLPYAGAMDPKQIQRFKNEAKAAASLKHDHIVSVHAIGCARGVHFYAMEFVDGQTLAQFIHGLRPDDRQPVAGDATRDYQPAAGEAPTKPIAALATEKGSRRDRVFYRWSAELIAHAADALEHAHSLGIVHRDVKPGNLLLDAEGQVYVSDFGLARFGPDAGLTMSGDLLGTLRYMAPEQALARHGLADHRVDVYGLGCTLYELLTGRPAVGGKDKADIVRRIAFEEPIGLRKIDKAIPAELETITLKCLAKNPNERYATAGELAEDLRRWLGDVAIKAKPPGVRERVAKWGRRHKYLLRSAAAVLGVAIVAVIVSSLLLWQERNATYAQYLRADERAEGESRAKSEAQRQSEQTRAVLDFVVTRILAAARPKDEAGGLGHDVKLADAVRSALPFVEKSFTRQPLIEAVLRGTMGTSFLYLGDPKVAAEQQEIARSIFMKHLGPNSTNTIAQTNNLANSYAALGRYVDALRLHEEALAACQKTFGTNDRRTLSSMSVLGLTYKSLGRYPEALDLHQKTLDLMRAHLGPNDPTTLGCMVNLALDYRHVGRHDHSLVLLQSAYAIMKEAMPDREFTLICLSSLASAYSDQARYDEALRVHEEVLKLEKNKYGPDHPMTLKSMQNIASTYHAMGQAEEALTRHEQALELAKAKLGVDNPNTLLSMNNVARCYQALRRYDEALKLNEETLRIRQKTPPLDQPETLESMDNLATSYYFVGRRPEALKLFEETLKLRKDKFGPENMQTLNSQDNLGALYSKLGRHKEAAQLHESAFRIMKAKFPGHVFTLNCMTNLASDYTDLGRHREAIELYEEALPLERAKLGVGSSVTQSNMQGLAMSYAALGRHEEAVRIYEELLPLQRIRPGVGHDLTHASMRGLADSYGALGRHDEAFKLYEEVLPLRRSKLGADHPDILNWMHNLACNYREHGRHADALKLHQETLVLRQIKFGDNHPDTLLSMWGVAENLLELDRGAEALPVIDECMRRAAGREVNPALIPTMISLRIAHFEKAKDAAGCRATAEMWEMLKRTDADSLYEAACWRAITAAVLRATDKPNDAVAEADRAMAWLSKAVATGYKDAAHMKEDTDLAMLRDREDFKKLVAKLEAKAK